MPNSCSFSGVGMLFLSQPRRSIDRIHQLFVLRFAVLAQVLHLFFGGHARRVDLDQALELLIVAFLARFVLDCGHRPHGAVGRIIVLAANTPHAHGKNLLEVVDPLRLVQQGFGGGRDAGHTLMDPGVVFDVLLHLGRFLGLLVVFGRDVVPGQFAQAMQAEPGAPHREVMQGLGLVLEGRQQVVDLIHEDQPGFVVLRTFGRQAKTALLGKRFLGQVFRDFHTLDFHADIVQKFGIGAIFADKQFLHVTHALTDDHAKAFAARHLVEQFQRRRAVAEVQFQTAGDVLC